MTSRAHVVHFAPDQDMASVVAELLLDASPLSLFVAMMISFSSFQLKGLMPRGWIAGKYEYG